jgi:hypothetical protein
MYAAVKTAFVMSLMKIKVFSAYILNFLFLLCGECNLIYLNHAFLSFFAK